MDILVLSADSSVINHMVNDRIEQKILIALRIALSELLKIPVLALLDLLLSGDPQLF